MLHGEVRINGHAIGVWTARRMVHPPGAVNTYEVTAEYRDLRGVLHSSSGEVEHNFGDGALVLASKVLAWAGQNIYPGRGQVE